MKRLQKFCLKDPEDDQSEIRLEIDSNKFIISYYQKLVKELRDSRRVEVNIDYPRIEDFRPIYFRVTEEYIIGILSQILEDVNKSKTNFIEILSDFSNITHEFRNDYISVGSDGIILIQQPLVNDIIF